MHAQKHKIGVRSIIDVKIAAKVTFDSDPNLTIMYVFLFLYSGRYILYYISISQVVHKQMIKAYPAP